MTRRAWIILSLLLPLTALAVYLLLPPRPPQLTVTASGFNELAGWPDDTPAAAVPALLRSCAAIIGRPDDAPLDPQTRSIDFGTVAEWQGVCARAAALPARDEAAARRFFEEGFAPFRAANNGNPDGLFTGYFEITLDGARQRGGAYQMPLYRRPPGPQRTRYTRAEIDGGALVGQGLELLWVDDPIGAFFLQIQGSGLVRLREGGLVRVGYDGSNGKPFVPVGRLLLERGIMPREKITMAGIRDWMRDHPKEGAKLRREDPSYVFFREIPMAGPLGAERVVLTPDRSLAVDRRFIALGTPIWLNAAERFSPEITQRLVIAQDTGGAIKGPVRGDLFWGHGKAAARGAGGMNAKGRYYLLLPRAVAARLSAVD